MEYLPHTFVQQTINKIYKSDEDEISFTYLPKRIYPAYRM